MSAPDMIAGLGGKVFPIPVGLVAVLPVDVGYIEAGKPVVFTPAYRVAYDNSYILSTGELATCWRRPDGLVGVRTTDGVIREMGKREAGDLVRWSVRARTLPAFLDRWFAGE